MAPSPTVVASMKCPTSSPAKQCGCSSILTPTPPSACRTRPGSPSAPPRSWMRSPRTRARFAQLILHAFKTAGATHTVLADSGLELLRPASQGLPRQAGRILHTALLMAAVKKLNHLPDDLLQQAITELR